MSEKSKESASLPDLDFDAGARTWREAKDAVARQNLSHLAEAYGKWLPSKEEAEKGLNEEYQRLNENPEK